MPAMTSRSFLQVKAVPAQPPADGGSSPLLVTKGERSAKSRKPCRQQVASAMQGRERGQVQGQHMHLIAAARRRLHIWQQMTDRLLACHLSVLNAGPSLPT